MQTSNNMRLACLIVVSISTLAQGSLLKPQAPGGAEGTVVQGGSGPCTADFVVSDPSGKGIYGAKIDIQIRYRFAGLHRLDATVSTNSEGKARIEGLPAQIKRTAEFKITYGSESKSFPYDPLGDCHSRHEVMFGGK